MTDETQDKRCGTCRWFVLPKNRVRKGDCAHPIPSSIYYATRLRMDAKVDATNCPTWAAKETPDEL